MRPKIHQFLSKVSTGKNLKNSISHSLNYGIWLIEGAQNLSRTDGVIELPYLETVEAVFPISYSQQNDLLFINEADLIATYLLVDDFIQQNYNASTAVITKVAIVDVKPEIQANGDIALKVQVVLEKGYEEEIVDGGCILSASWKTHTYGNNIGICSGTTTSSALNAAQRLQEIVNDRDGFNSCNPIQCKGFFTNVFQSPYASLIQNPNDLFPGDGHRDYIPFRAFSTQSQYTTCLDSDEMQFYLNGIYGMINNAVAMHNASAPGVFDFAGCLIYVSHSQNPTTGFAVTQHSLATFMGIFTPNGVPPSCYY